MQHNQENNEPVKPIDPVAPWLGGKSRLADTLVQWVNAVPHSCYAEPFVGMGGVFFRRNCRPNAEVINDYSRDVANLFRIVQRHFVPFVDMMRWGITVRAEFERLSKTDPDTLTDLERAARFLYLQKTAFGGKVTGQNFGYTPSRPGRFDVTKIVPDLEDLHARLSSVTVENLHYKIFIEKYDRPDTLFYCDPPYWGCEDDYGKNLFSPDDFAQLAATLAAIKGKVILSLNDTPEVREIFAGFPMEEVRTKYTISRDAGAQDVPELIIHNLPGGPPPLQAEIF